MFDADYLFLQRFPPALQPKVQAILDRASGVFDRRTGISTAPKDYQAYEKGLLVGQLIQSDPELAAYLSQADPPA